MRTPPSILFPKPKKSGADDAAPSTMPTERFYSSRLDSRRFPNNNPRSSRARWAE